MRKMITAALGTIATFVTVVLVAPTAHAFAPPEPAGPGPTPAAGIDAGVGLLSWQTAAVAVIAVALGAVVALVIAHYVRRSHAGGLVTA
jgi:ABC-type Fe3+ transport system permease subunit